MKSVILTFAAVQLLTNGVFAENRVVNYFCNFNQNGSEIFLKISEMSDENGNGNGNGFTTRAELTIDQTAPVLIPELQKISTTVPGLSFRSIVKWTAPELDLTGYIDHSFPSRTFSADLVLSGRPKRQGICQF